MDTASVILAVGSPPGRSGRGMIRASGAGVFDLIDALSCEAVPRTRGVGTIRLNASGYGLPAISFDAWTGVTPARMCSNCSCRAACPA